MPKHLATDLRPQVTLIASTAIHEGHANLVRAVLYAMGARRLADVPDDQLLHFVDALRYGLRDTQAGGRRRADQPQPQAAAPTARKRRWWSF